MGTLYTEPTLENMSKAHSLPTDLGRAEGQNVDLSKNDHGKVIASHQNAYAERPRTYQRLDPSKKEIRLLLLKAGQVDERVHCEVRHTSLIASNAVAYETISYVWGDATIRGEIFLNDEKLDVPLSSETVLRRMRLESTDRLVWLDAISIHQKDLDERNQQVAMMANIYSNAYTNLVWLGEGDPDPESSVTAIRHVVEDARRETNGFHQYVRTIFNVENEVWLYATKDFQFTIDFEAIKRFFARPLFGRLWVVQEAALAAHSICFYGELQLPLLDVLRAATWLLHKDMFLPFRPTHELGIRRAARIWILSDEGRRGMFPAGPSGAPGHAGVPNIINMLSNLQLFQASESRDHIYGMLGLYQKVYGGNLPTQLQPDYRRPLADVLRDATKLVIEKDQTLLCLNLLPEISMGECVAPNWMPRWHLQPDGRQHPGSFNWDESYACGRHMQHHTTKIIEQDEDILVTKGFLTDRISAILLSPEQETGPDAYIRGLRDIGKGLSRATVEVSATELEALMALSLIAEKDHSYKIIEAGPALELFRAWKNHLHTKGSLPPRARELKNQEKNPSLEFLKAAQYMQAFYNACRGRSIFVTEGGRLGIGMKRIKPGDDIAIMYGCTLPVIIRRLQNEFEYAVVSVAYVSGIMRGEAVTEHKGAGAEAGQFLLR